MSWNWTVDQCSVSWGSMECTSGQPHQSVCLSVHQRHGWESVLGSSIAANYAVTRALRDEVGVSQSIIECHRAS